MLLEESVKAFVIHYIMAAVCLLHQSRVAAEVVSESMTVHIHHSRFIWDNTMESLP